MIYFCIPSHNEEKTVGVVLWKLRQVMAEFPRDYLILLADDASTDKSAEILDPYRRVLPLVIMRTRTQRGYSATVEMLLREAVRRSRYPRRDAIVVLQADFTDDPENATALLKRIESGADIACGGPVAESGRRPFLERMARGYARRLLRRIEWPESADPLNGLNAYRLGCVKRAFEERADKRLLTADGPAANAALLRAAAPHARRIDVAEIRCHPERAQRPRRFEPLAFIRQVRRFAAGTEPAGLIAVADLVPDEVVGDLSVLTDPPANGSATAATAPRERRNGSPARRGRPAAEEARPRKSRGSRPRNEDGASRPAGDGTRKRTAAAAGGEPVRQKRPRRPPRAERQADPTGAPDATDPAGVPSAMDPTDVPGLTAESGTIAGNGSGEAAAGGPETGAAKPARRRRGSRGGRRRRESRAATSPADDTGVPEGGQAGTAGESGDSSAPSAAPRDPDTQDVVNEGDGTPKPQRRRRGRRGGRGRRGRRPDGTVDASGNDTSSGNDEAPSPTNETDESS